MARFGSVAELAAFLGKLDPDYAQHALALWQKGVKTPQQLASFSEPHYLACDVPEGHIDDIKARAGGAGEQLAYSNLFQHRSVETLSSKQWVMVASSTEESDLTLFSTQESDLRLFSKIEALLAMSKLTQTAHTCLCTSCKGSVRTLCCPLAVRKH